MKNVYELFFEQILRFYVKKRCSWELFVGILQLINAHPDVKYEIPDSKYKILKSISSDYVITEYNECSARVVIY